jgi:CBS domain-containing membrane protein
MTFASTAHEGEHFMKVKDAMEKDVLTLHKGDFLDVAENIMTLGRIRHLPIVDENGRLVGLVSQRDLLRASVASVLGLSRTAERDWLASISVDQVMSKSVASVGPETELAEAVELMVRQKYGCLPVVEQGRLVGLLTETDCLDCLLNLLKPGAAELARRQASDLEC